MKYLGIDYGTKRIGLAVSDDEGRVAFPNKVIQNSPRAVEEVLEIIANESVDEVVIGESKDFNMQDNPIMEKAKSFADDLSEKSGKSVSFHSEIFTSAQVATENHFSNTPREQTVRGEKKVVDLDAKAAALILQNFLDSKGK